MNDRDLMIDLMQGMTLNDRYWMNEDDFHYIFLAVHLLFGYTSQGSVCSPIPPSAMMPTTFKRAVLCCYAIILAEVE
jgi:hypothetical protein